MYSPLGVTVATVFLTGAVHTDITLRVVPRRIIRLIFQEDLWSLIVEMS